MICMEGCDTHRFRSQWANYSSLNVPLVIKVSTLHQCFFSLPEGKKVSTFPTLLLSHPLLLANA